MNAARLSTFARSAWAGPVLFLLAVLVRFAGIRWGLPNTGMTWHFHPDEPILWLFSNQLDLGRGDFAPSFYNYGTFYLTLTRIGSDMAAAYGGATPELWQQLARDTMVGRWISLLAGASIPWMIYALGLRHMRAIGAFLAAMAAVVAPGLVVHSRFMTVDMVGAALALGSLVAACMMLPSEHGKTWTIDRAAIAAGVLAGLSASTKYSGIFALAGLAAALWFATLDMRVRGKAMVFGVLAALLAFVLTTPGIFLEPEIFRANFSYELWHTSTGHDTVFLATAPGFIYHLANLFEGFGVLGLVVGVIGLVIGVRQRDPVCIVLAAFGLLTYILIGRAEVKFLRYTLPLIPVLAYGLGKLVSHGHANGGTKGRLSVVAGVLAVGGVLGGGAYGAGQYTLWMLNPDPREQAAEFIRQEGGTVGLVSDPWFYTPPLYPLATAPRFVDPAIRTEAMNAVQPRIYRHERADGTRMDWDLELLTTDQPDLVVFSSFEADDLIRMQAAGLKDDRITRLTEFRDRLTKDYDQVAAFGTPRPTIHDMMYVRPEIQVWRRKSSSNPNATGS